MMILIKFEVTNNYTHLKMLKQYKNAHFNYKYCILYIL